MIDKPIASEGSANGPTERPPRSTKTATTPADRDLWNRDLRDKDSRALIVEAENAQMARLARLLQDESGGGSGEDPSDA